MEQCLYTEMGGGFMIRNFKLFILLWLAIITIFLSGCSQKDDKEIDVYSSTKSAFENGYIEEITVINYEQEITNPEECAKEIIEKCINNDFPSVIFSFDLGYPSGLTAIVFQSEADVKSNNPVFEMSYLQESNNLEYNIKDNPEQFVLKINIF